MGTWPWLRDEGAEGEQGQMASTFASPFFRRVISEGWDIGGRGGGGVHRGL